MAEVACRTMTLAEFLVWDDGTDTRYELVGGEPRAMAPPEEAHGVIAANLTVEIRRRLKRPCRVVSEAGIVPLASDRTYFQADLAVTCSPPGAGRRCLVEPVLIVEVLSASTAEHDRGTKLPAYRRIPSVREILLVASEDRHVEHWTRQAEGWHVQDYIGDAEFALGLGDLPLSLSSLYEGVAFEGL